MFIRGNRRSWLHSEATPRQHPLLAISAEYVQSTTFDSVTTMVERTCGKRVALGRLSTFCADYNLELGKGTAQ
ncbi:hypothetical protein NECAME_17811 [Necator americanus]|uniref:Uncharacterized protein n=1 Tax=Necator americanus TaxID=51031 RepID=W2TIS6_NECAM|nr:hypothetical protein NECAME_17811 [Necator americanus]ETN82005.1 hypothetical protein NECAME_17811 [Necator americanus]